jgi:membrane-bound lytic murein transglycosylase A
MYLPVIPTGNWFQPMMKSVDHQQSQIPTLTPIAPQSIAGWDADDGQSALIAFQRQALEIQRKGSGFSRDVMFGGRHEDWLPVISAAQTAKNPRQFWLENFTCYSVKEHGDPQGLFTGYFEPEVEGSRSLQPDLTVPIYRKPNNLVVFKERDIEATGLKYGRYTAGHPQPYFNRQDIENGALKHQGLELCWLKSWIDAFFIHIQGSGRVKLSDGSVLRLSYAAKSGLPYTSIGAVLVERGLFTRETISMQALKSWMGSNPGEARALMWQNQSFIFLRELPSHDQTLGAIGAAQVHLTPLRSIAIDRRYWMFGTPMWLDTHTPPEAEQRPVQRMMIAQDTGSAITGALRGDVYWGWGETAELIAGHMKSKGTLHVFLPHAVVDRLGLPQ